MSFQGKLIAYLVCVALLIGFGYEVGTWRADAKAKAAEDKAVADYIDKQKVAQQEAADLEADKAKINAAHGKANKAREKDVKANPNNYSGGPSAVGLSLLNDALTGNPAR